MPNPPTINWSSQLTHTAVAIIGQELFSACYTTNPAGGPNPIYAVGTVFDVKNGQVNPYEPKRKAELGSHSDERAARASCEAFCRGEISPTPPSETLAGTGPEGGGELPS